MPRRLTEEQAEELGEARRDGTDDPQPENGWDEGEAQVRDEFYGRDL